MKDGRLPVGGIGSGTCGRAHHGSASKRTDLQECRRLERDNNRVSAENVKRKIVIEAGGSMNIYLVLDASDSVGEGNFSRARDVLVQLIEKISSYGVFPRYGVLTFATDPHIVVSTVSPQSSDADWVSNKLGDLKYESHALRSGTNTRAALEAVHNMIIQQEQDEIRKGHKVAPVANSTRHVLVLMTDGETPCTPNPLYPQTPTPPATCWSS
ncbi:complement factor B-like [Chelonoidis abingdonii]|uniref:complement factor B-like n=1 Tax=Chelonoidis abingdonii TaxID=106734 RepID=UPI003F496E34